MVYYNGAHSITFIDPRCGGIEKGIYEEGYSLNTWDDWGLIPSSRPSIAPPSRKTNIIEFANFNGLEDISLDYWGKPLYSNRSGSIEFILVNKDLDSSRKYKDWDSVYSEMIRFLTTNKMYMILDDEKSFYYEGYFSINDFKSNKTNSTIVIDYSLDPYKYRINNNLEKWLWDPFDFRNGIIYDDPINYTFIFTSQDGTYVTKKFTVVGYFENIFRIKINLKKTSISSTEKITLSVPFENTYYISEGETIFYSVINPSGLSGNHYWPTQLVNVPFYLDASNIDSNTNTTVTIDVREGTL